MTVAKRQTSVRKSTGSKSATSKSTGKRAVHDVGGIAALAVPIDRHEHDPSLYEKRVDALVMLLGGAKRGVFKIDAVRRVVESYAEQQYDQIAYYDKWIKAVRDLIVEQELVSPAEVEERMAVIRRQLEAEGMTVSNKPVM